MLIVGLDGGKGGVARLGEILLDRLRQTAGHGAIKFRTWRLFRTTALSRAA